MSVSVSIVIPAYNEAQRICDSIGQIVRFARGYSPIRELIVVDDGSTDDTAAGVRAAISAESPSDPQIVVLRHPANRGKGASVRTGFAAAKGDVVLFTDADLSAPISEAPRLIEPIAAGEYDVVIGSRALNDSVIELQQSLFRRKAGRMFNRMVRWSTGLPLMDTQCGFKAFRRSAMARAFDLQRIEGFAFDVELLYLARRLSLRTLELPVHWHHVEGSKVSMLRHTWEMALDLARIRLIDARGLYRINHVVAPKAR